MKAKLGIFNEEEQDESIIEDLLNMMHTYSTDYTNTFRSLTLDTLEDSDLFYSEEFAKWKEQWQARLSRQKESKADSQQLMRNSNPAVIPRNHREEEALEAAVEQGDYSVMEQLLEVLSNPFAHSFSMGFNTCFNFLVSLEIIEKRLTTSKDPNPNFLAKYKHRFEVLSSLS